MLINDLNESNWYLKPSIMMNIGASIFLIYLFGCCGAMREISYMMLIGSNRLNFFAIHSVLCVRWLTSESFPLLSVCDTFGLHYLGRNDRWHCWNGQAGGNGIVFALRLNDSLHEYEKYNNEWKNIQNKVNGYKLVNNFRKLLRIHFS